MGEGGVVGGRAASPASPTPGPAAPPPHQLHHPPTHPTFPSPGGFRPQFFPSLAGVCALFSRPATAASLGAHLAAVGAVAARAVYRRGKGAWGLYGFRGICVEGDDLGPRGASAGPRLASLQPDQCCAPLTTASTPPCPTRPGGRPPRPRRRAAHRPGRAGGGTVDGGGGRGRAVAGEAGSRCGRGGVRAAFLSCFARRRPAPTLQSALLPLTRPPPNEGRPGRAGASSTVVA